MRAAASKDILEALYILMVLFVVNRLFVIAARFFGAISILIDFAILLHARSIFQKNGLLVRGCRRKEDEVAAIQPAQGGQAENSHRNSTEPCWEERCTLGWSLRLSISLLVVLLAVSAVITRLLVVHLTRAEIVPTGLVRKLLLLFLLVSRSAHSAMFVSPPVIPRQPLSVRGKVQR